MFCPFHDKVVLKLKSSKTAQFCKDCLVTIQANDRLGCHLAAVNDFLFTAADFWEYSTNVAFFLMGSF